jgi:hypothetical protein
MATIDIGFLLLVRTADSRQRFAHRHPATADSRQRFAHRHLITADSQQKSAHSSPPQYPLIEKTNKQKPSKLDGF